ncbi:PRC-barrel domain-containing protein [Deinococcus radiodurans]|uniref:PRC-barrel domain-containing protein n=1 Tax=Deinococcus radiodurans TaxID=1299 RepID=UPI001FB7623F|nr:PRC-barrel domain-containing protein [Deinococcus radiodurans]
MIKGKELLGRPVVAVSNGAQVDNVHDVVFDHQGNRVLALLVEEGGWLRAAKAVPFGRVQSIGEKAVMIATPEDVVNTGRDPVLKEALAGKTNLIGMTLLTTDGQTLGKITDVYFDERSGQVEGYEASGGLFADMTNGRTFIPAPQSIQIGKDSAIVPAGVAAAMREQAPGAFAGRFTRQARAWEAQCRVPPTACAARTKTPAAACAKTMSRFRPTSPKPPARASSRRGRRRATCAAACRAGPRTSARRAPNARKTSWWARSPGRTCAPTTAC